MLAAQPQDRTWCTICPKGPYVYRVYSLPLVMTRQPHDGASVLRCVGATRRDSGGSGIPSFPGPLDAHCL